MRKILLAAILASSSFFARAVVLDARTTRRYVSPAQTIPAARPSGAVRLDFVCRGPVCVNTRLLFSDAAGRPLGSAFLWPSLKVPARAEWGRPDAHAMPIGAARKLPCDCAETGDAFAALRHDGRYAIIRTWKRSFAEFPMGR